VVVVEGVVEEEGFIWVICYQWRWRRWWWRMRLFSEEEEEEEESVKVIGSYNVCHVVVRGDSPRVNGEWPPKGESPNLYLKIQFKTAPNLP
jgi:hypothetical protein